MAQKRILTPAKLRPPGRPSAAASFERKVEDILERHANGEAFNTVCQELGVSPARFRAFVRKDPKLLAEYKLARQEYSHSLFDQIAELQQELANTKWGREDNARVQALRTAIDSLKHMTSRLNPNTYGEQKAGVQGVNVTIVTSLPMAPGMEPAKPLDTSFTVVGRLPSD